MRKKLTLRLESLNVDTFVPSDAALDQGTVRGAESDPTADSCGSYIGTECWPYCATGNWQCESINTCAGHTADCCKPSSNNVDCTI